MGSESAIGGVPPEIHRRSFIAGAAASVAAGSWRTGRTASQPEPPGLGLYGINFDTDREVWRSEFVRREVETIRRDLHAGAVLLLGHDLDRLTESAGIAAEQGLGVWFEPRQFDADAASTLDFLAATAASAERLRADHPDVALSVGVELTLFMAGLLPGSDSSERADALGATPPAEWTAGLNAFLADAAATARSTFGGRITYSSGAWEDVDWAPFDVVGVDMYRDADNAATFAADVRALHRHGKPVVITEYGCCAFRGAADLGGGGFTVIDFTASPPEIPAEYVRDEQVQATYLDELIDVFEQEHVHGAFVYVFNQPDSPHIPEYPQYDYDKASFGVVKCYGEGHELDYAMTGHFEPKLAFDVVARRFAAARSQG